LRYGITGRKLSSPTQRATAKEDEMNLQDFAASAAHLTDSQLFMLCESSEKAAIKFVKEGNLQAAGAAWGVWKCYEALLAARGFARS
jgi:hypothetical protein